MMPAAYQSAFAAALQAADTSGPLAALTKQPGFAVYRNTVLNGAIDAIEANFPAVTRLVGRDWLRAAAAEFVRVAPPRDPTLLRYGAAFPGFLAAFAPAAELPYLAPVARLDWYWNEAHVAPDAACADPTALARLDAGALARLRLPPHPAARWAWFADIPAVSIWLANRSSTTDVATRLAALTWQSEGVVITRPDDTVQVTPITHAACRLLEACAGGADFTTAAGAVLATDDTADLGSLVATLLRACAFRTFTFEPFEREAST